MSKIDYQALREKAEKATCGVWSLEYGEGRFDGDDALIHREAAGYIPICRIEGAHPESGFDEDFQIEQQANAEFIAAANPVTVLALLDERERNQQYIKRRDQENEDIALTVGKLRVELEAAENNLIDSECHVAELEEALRDKQALLEASEKRIAELETRTVFLPKLPVLGSTAEWHEGFAAGASSMRNECRNAICAAGIRIKGGEMTTITDKKQYPGEQYLNELITNIEFAARAPVEVVRAMAAELQKRREADSAEPASNHEELPLDYLQGQKDGLEWAAQLAEANHPQTGDWLYDDPLELAKAIRKGPDMPEFDGPTPVTPDGWISCSERMPAQDDWILIYSKHGEYMAGQVQGEYVELSDGTLSWLGNALYWMPLPEPQQEVK